ncbi:helix-turn-helix domain-containing protein [Enterococcus sp. LJL120]
MLAAGLLIKWLRISRNISQKQLSNELFISQSYLSKIERLLQKPSYEVMLQAFEFLNLGSYFKLEYESDNFVFQIKKMHYVSIAVMEDYYQKSVKQLQQIIERLALELVRFDCEVFNNQVKYLPIKRKFLEESVTFLERNEATQEQKQLLFIFYRSLIYFYTLIEEYDLSVAYIDRLVELIKQEFPSQEDELYAQSTNRIILLYYLRKRRHALFRSMELTKDSVYLATARKEYLAAVWLIRAVCEVYYGFFDEAAKSLKAFWETKTTDEVHFVWGKILEIQLAFYKDNIDQTNKLSEEVHKLILKHQADEAFLRNIQDFSLEYCMILLEINRKDLFEDIYPLANKDKVIEDIYPFELACYIFKCYHYGDYEAMEYSFSLLQKRKHTLPYRVIATLCDAIAAYYDQEKKYKEASKIRKFSLDYYRLSLDSFNQFV